MQAGTLKKLRKQTSYFEEFHLKRDEFLTPIEMLEILNVPYHTMFLAELYAFHQGKIFDTKNCTEILRDFFTDLVKQPKTLLRYLRYSRSWPFGGYYGHLDQVALISELPKLTISGRFLDQAAPDSTGFPWKFSGLIDASHFLFQESNSVALRLGINFDSKTPSLLIDEANPEPQLLGVINLYKSGNILRFSYRSMYIDFETAIRILEMAFRIQNKDKSRSAKISAGNNGIKLGEA